MKTMKFNSYGNKYDLCIGVEEYYYGGGLAMQLYCVEGDFLEPFSSLTINVLDFLPGKNCALVDTNDFAQAKDLIEKYKLGKPTGRWAASGYYIYREYEFDMAQIEKYRLPDEPQKEEPKKHRSETR